MRVTRDQAAANRQRVIEEAVTLFKAGGFSDPSIDEVMAAAGLTRGAFYGQFSSKEALETEAFSHGADESVAGFSAAAAAGAESLTALVESYLSVEHRDDAGNGCAVGALGPEIVRASAEKQVVLAKALYAMSEAIERGQGDAEAGGDSALTMVTSMLGAIFLSRAVARADPELSQRILDANRDAITAMIQLSKDG